MERVLTILQSGQLNQLQLPKDNYHIRLLVPRLNIQTLSSLDQRSLKYLIDNQLINAPQWFKIWTVITGRYTFPDPSKVPDMIRNLNMWDYLIESNLEIPNELLQMFDLTNWNIEQLVILNHCHEIDTLCQTSKRSLILKDLHKPHEYPMWCDHCRERLLPYDRCIVSKEDFQVAVKIVCGIRDSQCDVNKLSVNKTLESACGVKSFRTGSSEPLFRVMITKCGEYCDQTTLSQLLSIHEYHQTLLEEQKRDTIVVMLPFSQYSWNYHPNIHSFFQFDIMKMDWSDFKRYPDLINRIDQRLLSNDTFSRFLKQCCRPNDRCDCLKTILQSRPNIIYQNPSIIEQYPKHQMIRQLKQQVGLLIFSGIGDPQSPISLIDRYVIKKIMQNVWSTEETKSLKCICGNTCSKKCQYQKCAHCCTCSNHKRHS